VPYAICCDCGLSDADMAGICDDIDCFTDKTAPNRSTHLALLNEFQCFMKIKEVRFGGPFS